MALTGSRLRQRYGPPYVEGYRWRDSALTIVDIEFDTQLRPVALRVQGGEEAAADRVAEALAPGILSRRQDPEQTPDWLLDRYLTGDGLAFTKAWTHGHRSLQWALINGPALAAIAEPVRLRSLLASRPTRQRYSVRPGQVAVEATFHELTDSVERFSITKHCGISPRAPEAPLPDSDLIEAVLKELLPTLTSRDHDFKSYFVVGAFAQRFCTAWCEELGEVFILRDVSGPRPERVNSITVSIVSPEPDPDKIEQ